MHPVAITGTRRFIAVAALLAVAGCASSPPLTSGGATEPPPEAPTPDAGGRIVQPGAPGEPTKSWDGSDLDEVEGVAWTEADVTFMQGMIHHHAQALEMTALIEERTETEAIRQMGLRMEISQGDEIALMSRWLEARDRSVPAWRSMSTIRADGGAGEARGGTEHAGMDHATMDHTEGTLHAMPGMLSPQQMRDLEAARGEEFDRLFLEYMIQHHEGAIVMVRELFSVPGAGQESRVFHFASEVDADQTIEIRRMRQLLAGMR